MVVSIDWYLVELRKSDGKIVTYKTQAETMSDAVRIATRFYAGVDCENKRKKDKRGHFLTNEFKKAMLEYKPKRITKLKTKT